MKFRRYGWAVPACAMMVASCGKKEEAPASKAEAPKAAEAAGKAETPVVPEPVKPEAPKVSTADRAAKLGFAKHLPQDTETLLAVYDISGMSKRFKATKAWKLIEESTGMKSAEKEEQKAEEVSGPGALFGQEVFLATGKSSAGQLDHLLTLNRRSSYFQFRFLAKALANAAKAGEFGDFPDVLEESQQQSYLELLKDQKSGLPMIDQSEMPPVYVGFKTTPENRPQVAQQIASIVEYLKEMEEMVEPVDFDCAGGKFAGYRIAGAKVVEKLKSESEGEGIEKALGKEEAAKLLEVLAKKNLVVASGTVGDYVVVYLGSSVEGCKLVTDEKDSLAAMDKLAFADSYLKSDLAAMIYVSPEMAKVTKQSSEGFSDLTEGFREGLANAENAAETRDLQDLMQLLGERADALMKLGTTDTYGLVSYFDQGLRIESFGGNDGGAIDWKAPLVLGNLGNTPDTVLSVNFSSDATYDTHARDYARALVETAYAFTRKAAELKIEDESFQKFQGGFKMFDETFRTDVVELIDAISGDFSAGLGRESALVVDLKGGMPAFPGVPQVLVEKGKFVRASWVTTVTDRAKLAASWEKMNGATTNLLKKVSEMADKDIPMQKPMSSEKGGFTTWFISMPFFNDDFVPSVTLDDKWFVASTSKLQAHELLAKAGKEPSNDTGVRVKLNLDPVRTTGLDWLNLVDQNADVVFKDAEGPLEEFKKQKETILKSLEVASEFESIQAHVRRESGKLRGSVHFKTR